MSENRLMFWQRMARHYTTVMGRSAPLYREVCSRIHPHLNRDMNVLELACGTGQLSFPLSPYVRLWEATDFSSNMIAEAKRQVASSRLHFSVQDAADLPYAPETFDAVVIANALHILQGADKGMGEMRWGQWEPGWVNWEPMGSTGSQWGQWGHGGKQWGQWGPMGANGNLWGQWGSMGSVGGNGVGGGLWGQWGAMGSVNGSGRQ